MTAAVGSGAEAEIVKNLPVAISILSNLIQRLPMRPLAGGKQQQLKDQVKAVRAEIVKYAEDHQALLGWKLIHDDLHSIGEQMTELASEARKGSGTGNLQNTWKAVKRSIDRGVFARSSLYHGVPRVWDVVTPVGPHSLDWSARITEHYQRIDRSAQPGSFNSDAFENAANEFDQEIHFLIARANTYLIEEAERLASMSNNLAVGLRALELD